MWISIQDPFHRSPAFISLLFTAFFCATTHIPAALKPYPYILATIRKKGKTCKIMCGKDEVTTAGCTTLWTIHTFWKPLQSATSMQHSASWEAKSFSTSHKIPSLSSNMRVHFCVYYSLPHVQSAPFSSISLIYPSTFQMGVLSNIVSSTKFCIHISSWLTFAQACS